MGQTLIEFLRQLREQATQVWGALGVGYIAPTGHIEKANILGLPTV